jgi:hypothetical protein
MRSTSPAKDQTRYKAEYISQLINQYISTGTSFSSHKLVSKSLAQYFMAMSLHLFFPSPISARTKNNIATADMNFSSLVDKVSFVTLLKEILNLYPNFVAVAPEYTNALTDDNAALKNYISNETRMKLVFIWNQLGVNFQKNNQMGDAVYCTQFASEEGATIKIMDATTFAQFNRDTASSLFELALRHQGSIQDITKLMQTAISFLQKIPGSHKTAPDYINCLAIQSALTQNCITGTANFLNSTFDIAAGINNLQIANAENNLFNKSIAAFREQCPAMRAHLDKMKIKHNQDYLQALKTIDFNNPLFIIETKIQLMHSMLNAYRAIPVDHVNGSNNSEMLALQQSFISVCENHLSQLMMFNTLPPLTSAHLYQAYIMEEYQIIMNRQPTLAAQLNYNTVVKEYILLKMRLALLNTEPASPANLKSVNEAIALANTFIANSTNIIAVGVERNEYHEFLRGFTSLLNAHSVHIDTVAGNQESTNYYHDTIVAMLSNIPLSQQTVGDQTAIFDHLSPVTLPNLIDPFGLDDTMFNSASESLSVMGDANFDQLLPSHDHYSFTDYNSPRRLPTLFSENSPKVKTDTNQPHNPNADSKNHRHTT